MTQIYEGMFLLDNDVVREGWDGAKGLVTGTLRKHGATVLTARRWKERRLAYPIQGRRRATYFLAYYQIPGGSIQAMRREFDLSERVLRYLMLAVDGVPEGESELSAAESAADFIVPPPPADDAPEVEEASDSGETRDVTDDEDDAKAESDEDPGDERED